MSIRPIIRYPDPRLLKAAAPIALFDDRLRMLATEMLASLRAAPGVGIAGPHIGEPWRIVILDLPLDPSQAATVDGSSVGSGNVYINPEIIRSSKQTITHDEGSISMPGVLEKIVRPWSVQVRYQDLDGTTHVETAEGFRAVCHQHEIDQLDGIFWLQRLSALKRDRALKRFRKLHGA